MKFENRKQKLIPFPLFLKRMGRFSVFSLSLIALSVLAGTLGYRYFGGMSWLNSFYMASMILSGMGPIADLNSVAGKLFSSFYALYSGLAFLSISAIFFTPIVHRILHALHIEQEGRQE
ncbi:MAG: hypothetical protein IT240_00035 [Bacteroidia bacterium]|nr:hypothetical protein [Bacteroidia bacterium]MCC6767405.1 hypothetical protein [Bacteroidia bacterium]